VLGEVPNELLLERYQRGDARAFELLVNRCRAPLFNYILRFLGEPQMAEDVFQEAFVRVLQNAARFERRAKFTTWLYTIARNLCIDAQRKARYRRASYLDAPAGEDSGVARLARGGAGHNGATVEEL
jgi:RNA polymerase sigma-70 factor (ECF subfamily)